VLAVLEAVIIVLLVFVLILVAVYHRRTVERLKAEIEAQARTLFKGWVRSALENERRRIEEDLRSRLQAEYQLMFQRWIQEKEREIREDAIRRSVSTILGRIGEHIAPLVAAYELGADPRDFRYIGSPIDYIVFKGLSRGEPEEIVFVEVKTGKSAQLTERERSIRRLVEQGKVSWRTVSLYQLADRLQEILDREIKAEVDRQLAQTASSAPSPNTQSPGEAEPTPHQGTQSE